MEARKASRSSCSSSDGWLTDRRLFASNLGGGEAATVTPCQGNRGMFPCGFDPSAPSEGEPAVRSVSPGGLVRSPLVAMESVEERSTSTSSVPRGGTPGDFLLLFSPVSLPGRRSTTTTIPARPNSDQHAEVVRSVLMIPTARRGPPGWWWLDITD